MHETESKNRWLSRALERYEVPLLRYATSILRDADRARDVVQDTFLELCDQKPERVAGHLAEWLFTVCRNRALDLRRREGRVRSLGETDADSIESPAEDSSVALEHGERLGAVLRAIDALPQNQREVVRLKFQCDLSYLEISRVTGLSVSNVGFLIHTAIKRLRTRIAPETEPVRGVLRRIR